MTNLSFWSCIRFSIQLMLSGTVFAAYFPGKRNFAIRFVIGELLYFTVVLGIFFCMQAVFRDILLGEILYYLLMFLMGLVLVKGCFDVSGKEIIFIGTGAYAVQHLTHCLTQLSLYLPIIGRMLDGKRIWESGIPYLIVPVCVYYILSRNFKEQAELKERDVRMMILSMGTIFITIVVSLLARRGTAASGQEFVYNLYGTLCCILALFILIYIPKENRMRHEQEMLEQMIRVMGEQQQITKESVEIINRKCHDIKHQMKALMQMEDAEERKKYTEEIRQAISIYDAVYQTGNSALDFVLREKSLRCQEYEIKLSCLTDGKALDFMETLDIYALFGNVLDNAIESVIKESDQEKRLINLHILRRGGMLHIHEDNYCGEQVEFADGLPVTSKAEKEYHGFGVKSICHIAEKYDGEAVVKQEGERFILDILIPIA